MESPGAIVRVAAAAVRRTVSAQPNRPAVGVSLALPLLLAIGTAHAGPAEPAIVPAFTSALVIRGSDDFDRLSQPLGVAIDSAHHEIYVANSGLGRIDVFSFDGRLKARLAHTVPGPSGARVSGIPIKLALDPKGRLFVVDARDSAVDVLDYRGRSIGRLSLSSIAGRPMRPTAVVATADGRVVVTGGEDSARVFVFSAQLEPIGQWGDGGTGPGKLRAISALAMTPTDELIIAGIDGDPMIQIFTLDGRFVRGFGFLANGPGNFSHPTGVAATSDGRIWVCDNIRQSIQVFDSSGAFLGSVGDFGNRAGQFAYPHSLATDGASRLVVTERMGGRFQLLTLRSR